MHGGVQGHSNPSEDDDALGTPRNYHSRGEDRVVGMVDDGHNKVIAASSLVRGNGHAGTSCHGLS